MMRRARLLDRLDSAWHEFRESFADLADARMTEPGVAGDWSVKDVIAHVTWWEEEALKHLPLIIAGGRSPRYSVVYGGIDAFNALKAGETRDRSLAEVLTEAEATHRRLIDFLERAPGEQFVGETRFRRRLRLDTYGHYPLHTAMIREWRERISDQ
jgi:uncharacterized protein (TIGR03083 family)